MANAGTLIAQCVDTPPQHTTDFICTRSVVLQHTHDVQVIFDI